MLNNFLAAGYNQSGCWVERNALWGRRTPGGGEGTGGRRRQRAGDTACTGIAGAGLYQPAIRGLKPRVATVIPLARGLTGDL